MKIRIRVPVSQTEAEEKAAEEKPTRLGMNIINFDAIPEVVSKVCMQY